MLTKRQTLKLRLMTHGLKVSDTARDLVTEGRRRPITLAEYATTSGVSMHLGEDVWVNAPLKDFNANFVEDSCPTLDASSGQLFIRDGQLETEVQVVPVPNYYNMKNDSDEPYSHYAATHTDRVRISPIAGCSMACSFCDLPFTLQYRRKRIDGLVESAGVALADQRLPAKHVLISGGTPKQEDFAYERMVYRTVAEHFADLHVDVMMVPMPGLLDAKELFEMGIWSLSINVEMFNPVLARRYMPVKARLGEAHYLDFIERAVEIFGPGRVRSLIIVGLEQVEETLNSVRKLAERGCDPVLSPFRPDPKTPLRDTQPPDIDLLKAVYLESYELTARHEVKLGPRCIPCQHNTLSFSDGTDDYYYS